MPFLQQQIRRLIWKMIVVCAYSQIIIEICYVIYYYNRFC